MDSRQYSLTLSPYFLSALHLIFFSEPELNLNFLLSSHFPHTPHVCKQFARTSTIPHKSISLTTSYISSQLRARVPNLYLKSGLSLHNSAQVSGHLSLVIVSAQASLETFLALLQVNEGPSS